MIPELRVKINEKLVTVTSSVYFDKADPNDNGDYLVFSRPNGVNDFDSENEYPTEFVQISGYSKTLTDLETIEAGVKSVIKDQHSNFSLTSYNVTDIDLQFERQSKTEDNVYFFIHQYKFDVEPK